MHTYTCEALYLKERKTNASEFIIAHIKITGSKDHVKKYYGHYIFVCLRCASGRHLRDKKKNWQCKQMEMIYCKPHVHIANCYLLVTLYASRACKNNISSQS